MYQMPYKPKTTVRPHGTSAPRAAKQWVVEQEYDLKIGENLRDILFCHLNEIDPEVLDYSSDSEDESEEDNPIDPRTKKIVQNFLIDHTQPKQCVNIYEGFPTKSSLPRGNHEAILRVLKSKDTRRRANLRDSKMYANSMQKLEKERKLFNDFVRNYEMGMIKTKTDLENALVCFGGATMKLEIDRIESQLNEYFQLVSAVPLQKHKINGRTPEVKSVVIHQFGEVPKLFEDFKSISRFVEKSCSEEFIKENYKLDCVQHFDGSQTELFKAKDIVIPTSSLFLILLSLEEEIEEWEIPLAVRDQEGSDEQMLVFGEPFPQREYVAIVDKYLRYSLHLTNTNFYSLSDGKVLSNELCQTELNQGSVNQIEYNLIKVEDYKNPSLEYRKNQGVVYSQCTLKSNESGKKFEIILISTPSSFKISEEKAVLTNVSLKLEHKVEFGAEVLSKRELILEWVNAISLPGVQTERVRVDVKTSSEYLRQTLRQKDIEAELHNHYDLIISESFNSLFETFATLKANFPAGEYLLKLKPKSKDKIMIYQHCQENQAVNSINKYDLFKNYNACISLEQSQCFTPIDVTVITPMHEYYRVIPGCFPHWGKRKCLIQNDRKNILEKCIKKNEEKETKLKEKERLMKKRRLQVKHEKRKLKLKKIKSAKALEDETLRCLTEGNRNFDDKLVHGSCESERGENSCASLTVIETNNAQSLDYSRSIRSYNDEFLNDVFGSNQQVEDKHQSTDKSEIPKITIDEYIAQAHLEDCEEEDILLN